ncbi:MAG: cyclic nucleotide-binding domain-containing protein [Anaerolineales bacterium]|nr:cyclic nucleotide-binding domain-containing protein [Chloroflexota bacterium]MBL6981516.1 cyclic nucleotide-binding domain-containing protein [Anaerolineales bacterium]
MSIKTNLLKQADIFFDFSQTQLELVANLCQERTFDNGDIIFYEHTNSDELYIITQGKVDIFINPNLAGRNSGNNTNLLSIAMLQRGQSFGEIALVDQGLRSATAQAAQNKTKLLVIRSSELRKLCDVYPQLGYQLMFNLAADLSMKIRNTDLRIREELLYSRKNK